MGMAVVLVSMPSAFVWAALAALLCHLWLWWLVSDRMRTGASERAKGLALGGIFAVSLLLSNTSAVLFPQFWPWPQLGLGLVVSFSQFRIIRATLKK